MYPSFEKKCINLAVVVALLLRNSISKVRKHGPTQTLISANGKPNAYMYIYLNCDSQPDMKYQDKQSSLKVTKGKL